jgi:putative endonuclease
VLLAEGNLTDNTMRPTFYTYMVTNWFKTTLYTGMTNNLAERLVGHYIGKEGSFTSQYQTYYLVWHEETKYVLNAIAREKEIKHYTRAQKEALIKEFNPEWRFLNEDVLGNWPPTEEQILAVKEKWSLATEVACMRLPSE